MAEIIIIGGGVSGLASAIVLGQAGHKVSVFEKQSEEELGYPWEDCINESVVKKITGIDNIEDEMLLMQNAYFYSPCEKYPILNDYIRKKQYMINRKKLSKMLIAKARESGCTVNFEINVKSVVIEEDAVKGIIADGKQYSADLVIDASGINSPFRSQLPENAGIEKGYASGDALYTYRAYFEKTPGTVLPEVPYATILKHRGENGLSWINAEEEHIDILIGRTFHLTESFIETVLKELREKHDYLSDKKIFSRYEVIPIRRCAKKFAWNGYICIGDCAFMTYPMCGSGIDISITAAYILGDTVAHITETGSGFTQTALYEYEKEFKKKFDAILHSDEMLKNALMACDSKALDYFFEKNVISESDISGGEPPTLKDNLLRVVRGLKYPRSFSKIIKAVITGMIEKQRSM